MKWIEDLPEQCPPQTACKCKGIYFRIIKKVPVNISEFCSNRVLFPDKAFNGIDECIIRSCSIQSSFEVCKKNKKYSRFKGCKILKFRILEKDGVLKKTFSKDHYSFWVSDGFKPEERLIEVIDE